MYNAREHPKYKNGEMTEKEVFVEFLKNFEPNDEKDGKVSARLYLLLFQMTEKEVCRPK